MQREVLHRLLDDLLDLKPSLHTGELNAAKRHFLTAKKEFLLGALSLVDLALKHTPEDEGTTERAAKSIPIED